MRSVFQSKTVKTESSSESTSQPEALNTQHSEPLPDANMSDKELPIMEQSPDKDEQEDEFEIPPEPIRWFHAVDSPLTKPNEPKKNPKTPAPPRKPATTWVPFSIRDSGALERAFQLIQPMREERKAPLNIESAIDGGEMDDNQNSPLSNTQQEPLLIPSTASMPEGSEASATASTVLVNEDHLFEVNINKMEIKPVYWQGPTYEVRRAVWFLQYDGKFVPCEANLSQQIEYGYIKHRPWIITPPILDANGKEVVEDKPEKSWALLGKYISQYVVFSDAHHAYLLSDDLRSKVAKTIFTKVSLQTTLGGTHLIRGYDEVENFISKKASEDASQKKKEGTEPKRKETSEVQKKREVAQKLKEKTKRLTEEEKDSIQESHEIDDYSNEEDAEVRTIDHLVLVIHGVGQKLGDRMEAINFIHDVNVMRRTMKETAATFIQNTPNSAAPKNQVVADRSREAPPVAASKNPYSMPSGFGVQVLPVEWRRQIIFGMATDDGEIQRDLSTPEAEEGCPTMEDIMLDGVPSIRMLASDVLMDVLLYMTPSYKRKMMEVVTTELNNVYRKFIHHNPDFLRRGGKVSILGHSLGSLLALDILNHQPFSPNHYQPVPSSPVYEKFISFDRGSINPVALDFPVTNFFALGSPIGLFLLLKGCKLGARLSDGSTTGESTLSPCFRPAVENLFNIFHRSDPVAYRVEPLISRSFGSKTRPALVPYHKGGLKGLHIGIQDFSNDLANRANTMMESVKLGITTSAITRALGFKTNPVANAAVIHNAKAQGSGSIPGQASDTELTTIVDGGELTEVSTNSNGNTTPRMTPEMFSAISKAKVRALNKTGRVDWCLQEGVFENAYLSALSVHMQYWSDSDVAAFIIRQTYDMNQ
ncbi:hypothetical protein BX616_006915 [Lobosporangium transversale]|uniref:DDHD domain-domain-containing protein n=1 Tax=Lobosporangium transversale TaxID=64571 RepID=A0A1Y2GDW1_9FUNG|nr:DDHD domain-domain-containing protein [Lobosporangium transversale]KAF9918669.1 hypothetical protein BX616_006915 [Lobosporangium transversale]ORZ07057.1 DDHD domain-domain-containing protein [Lobosporangium transversale]|eukprot:XP_021877853.1 DDHD domain-domain-containing protein [Lobosporangium transversale]